MASWARSHPAEISAFLHSPALPLLLNAGLLFYFVCLWKIFEKAGQPGWGALIPIYNIVLTLRIAGKPSWWFLLCLVPFVNVVVVILMFLCFVQKFGKG